MERKRFSRVPCPIARSLDVLGDWWTPLILREALYGVSRFDDFQHWLGIGRNILTRRLALLVEHGVLSKEEYAPNRFEYRLTEKGYAATKVLLATMAFGDEWAFSPGKEPIAVFDRRTGRRVRPVVTDAETGERLDPRTLYAGPGPGFPGPKQARHARFVEFYERHPAE
jgi:DNA-binding HxlR family transcriptional regulator